MYLCMGFGEPMAMNCICMDVLMFQEAEDIGMYCGKDTGKKGISVGMQKGRRYGS